MAAQIITFPKLEPAKGQKRQALVAAILTARQEDPTRGLHIVSRTPHPDALPVPLSQQTALRIVADVCTQYDLRHPGREAGATREADFWEKMPIAPARVETPFTVAKRVAHMILPSPVIA